MSPIENGEAFVPRYVFLPMKPSRVANIRDAERRQRRMSPGASPITLCLAPGLVRSGEGGETMWLDLAAITLATSIWFSVLVLATEFENQPMNSRFSLGTPLDLKGGGGACYYGESQFTKLSRNIAATFGALRCASGFGSRPG